MQLFLKHSPLLCRYVDFSNLAIYLFMGHLLVEFHLHVLFADLQLSLAEDW